MVQTLSGEMLLSPTTRRNAGPPPKRQRQRRDVRVAEPIGDLGDRRGGIRQQALRGGEARVVDQFGQLDPAEIAAGSVTAFVSDALSQRSQAPA